MYVYKITNSKNNKVYIGQTVRTIEQRFKRHLNDALNNIIDTHFSRAIRKYGAECFHVELIDTAKTQDELNYKEHYWINKYDSTNPKYGYNETDAIYKCGGNTYQSKTKDEMDKISNKIRKNKVGGKNPMSKKVKCKNVITNEEIVFDSFSKCREYFNEKTHRFITTRVTKQTKSLYKNQWAFAYLEDEYSYTINVHKKGRQLIAIINDKKTTYNSIRLFCRENNIDRAKMNNYIKKYGNNFIIDNIKITILN